MANTIFLNRSYRFWLILLIVIIFFIWLFGRKKKYPYIGLSPLIPNSETSNPLYQNIIKNDDNVTVISTDTEASYISAISTGSRRNKQQLPKILEDVNHDVKQEEKPFNDDQKETIKINNYEEIKNNKLSNKESKGEAICRQIFENIFKCKFPTVRLDFLTNPLTNHNLELDGYNEEKQLAFEYNGVQHYEFPNCFHKTKEIFLEQQERDRYKTEICKKAGICLITIPYYVPYNNLETYIKANLPRKYI